MAEIPRLRAFPPILDLHTRVVVLGSFPGVASLQAHAYYANPRNQFWSILSAILSEPLVQLPYEKRIECLLVHRIGLWDIYGTCRREGSLDSAIRSAVPNDLTRLAREAPKLRLVLHNGAESARRLREVQALGLAAIRLPSTSPANARWSFEAKREAWAEALAMAGIPMQS